MDRRRDPLGAEEKRVLQTLSLLSGKWQPVILLVLGRLDRPGFNEIQRTVPDISGKVLTDTLQTLQEAGLVERTVVGESPLRVEYELTPAGRELDDVFDTLARWGDRHLETVTATVLVVGADNRVNDMYTRWLSDRYAVRQVDDDTRLPNELDDDVDVVLFDQYLSGVDPKLVQRLSPADCWTVLLADERPSFDVLSIPSDGVLCKPLLRSTLLETVDRYLSRDGSTDRRLDGLIEKKRLFERVYDDQELTQDRRYAELQRRIESLVSDG